MQKEFPFKEQSCETALLKTTVHFWLDKSTASLNELQKLIGLLSFAATCV